MPPQNELHHYGERNWQAAGATKRPTDAAVGPFTRQTMQNAGKPGHRETALEPLKSLQTGLTQWQRRTTEKRGVPGSSPGLAIRERA